MKRVALLSFICCLCIGNIFSQTIDPLLIRTIEENRIHEQDVRTGHIKATTPTPVTPADSTDGMKVIDDRQVTGGTCTMDMKERINLRYNSDGSITWISVIGRLKEGAECPTADLEAIGVKVTCQVGVIVCMSVPIRAWNALSRMDVFERLSADYINHLDNTSTRTITSAAYVTGEKDGAALPQTKYTGKGVIVGIIDTGIDFNHASFCDAEGNTRIKEALVFTSYSAAPTICTTKDSIEALTTGTKSDTHGSHTAATAAGSQIPNIDCRGMAPEADLVLCDLNTLYNSHLIKAAQEIFRYADSVGKPAVINLSLGGHNYPYNGSGDIQTAYATLTDGGKKAGHIICFSAGNEAADYMGLSKKIEGGTLKTAVSAIPSLTTSTNICHYYNVNFVVYNVGGHPFTVTLKAIDKTTGEVEELSGLTKKDSVVYELTTSYSSTQSVSDGLTYNTVTIYPGSNFYLNKANYLLAVEVSGEDGDEIRIVDQYGGRYIRFYGENEYSSLEGYSSCNGNMSINSLACTDAVLSVGAFTGNYYFSSINGIAYYNTKLPTGKIAYFSSFGKDDHGIARPDILAPGVWLNSALNIYCPYYFTDQQLNSKLSNYFYITGATEITKNEKTRLHAVGAMSGTSMACPVASGIIALWLQANPDLTVKDIREMFTNIALNDKYTTDANYIPSKDLMQAGRGKIDALRGIKQILGTDKYPMDEEVTISEARLSTFSSSYPLNFASTAAPKAYIASAYDGTNMTFQRQEGALAANTGLLLNAEPGTYKIPIAATGTTPSSNMLYGTATGSVTLQEAAEAYVLVKPEGKAVGFYPNAAGLLVGQGKAYLKLEAGTPAVKEMSLVFNDEILNNKEDYASAICVDPNDDDFFVVGEATGIESISHQPDTYTIYNLAGQKLNRIKKGINIINGKKHIIL